jgi:Transposase IS200 like
LWFEIKTKGQAWACPLFTSPCSWTFRGRDTLALIILPSAHGWRFGCGVMAGFARVAVPGIPYHVTHRGNLRSDVFFCDAGRQAYLNLLRQCSERFGLEIRAYCLMTNHIHLIVAGREQNSLSRAADDAALCTCIANIKIADYGPNPGLKQNIACQIWAMFCWKNGCCPGYTPPAE